MINLDLDTADTQASPVSGRQDGQQQRRPRGAPSDTTNLHHLLSREDCQQLEVLLRLGLGGSALRDSAPCLSSPLLPTRPVCKAPTLLLNWGVERGKTAISSGAGRPFPVQPADVVVQLGHWLNYGRHSFRHRGFGAFQLFLSTVTIPITLGEGVMYC